MAAARPKKATADLERAAAGLLLSRWAGPPQSPPHDEEEEVEVWVLARHRPPRPGSRGAVHGGMRGERVRRRAREQGEGAKLRQSREHGEQSEAR